MRYEQAEKHYGGLAAMVRALKLAKTTVHSWKRRGAIPWEHQYDIELDTGGKLKADKRNGR